MRYRLLVAFNCAVNVRLPGCFHPLEVMYKTGHLPGHALHFHIGTAGYRPVKTRPLIAEEQGMDLQVQIMVISDQDHAPQNTEPSDVWTSTWKKMMIRGVPEIRNRMSFSL